LKVNNLEHTVQATGDPIRATTVHQMQTSCDRPLLPWTQLPGQGL